MARAAPAARLAINIAVPTTTKTSRPVMSCLLSAPGREPLRRQRGSIFGLVSVMRHRAEWGLGVGQSAHEAIRSPYDFDYGSAGALAAEPTAFWR